MLMRREESCIGSYGINTRLSQDGHWIDMVFTELSTLGNLHSSCQLSTKVYKTRSVRAYLFSVRALLRLIALDVGGHVLALAAHFEACHWQVFLAYFLDRGCTVGFMNGCTVCS